MQSFHSGQRIRGFTLIELLVVIGIIGVLVSILLPALGRAQQEAMKIVCASQLRNWGQAVANYAGDNRGQFVNNRGVGRSSMYRLDNWYFCPFLEEYLLDAKSMDNQEQSLLHCPTLERSRYAGHTRHRNSQTSAGYQYFTYKRTNSSHDYYVGAGWFERERMGGEYAAAPYMADRWQNSSTSSRDELGDVHWAAHTGTGDRSSGRGSHPPGKNFLFEDGSVSWHSKESLRVSVNYHSTGRQWMQDTNPAGLVNPDYDY